MRSIQYKMEERRDNNEEYRLFVEEQARKNTRRLGRKVLIIQRMGSGRMGSEQILDDQDDEHMGGITKDHEGSSPFRSRTPSARGSRTSTPSTTRRLVRGSTSMGRQSSTCRPSTARTSFPGGINRHHHLDEDAWDEYDDYDGIDSDEEDDSQAGVSERSRSRSVRRSTALMRRHADELEHRLNDARKNLRREREADADFNAEMDEIQHKEKNRFRSLLLVENTIPRADEASAAPEASPYSGNGDYEGTNPTSTGASDENPDHPREDAATAPPSQPQPTFHDPVEALAQLERELLAGTVDVRDTNWLGETPLHIAAALGAYDALVLLVDHRADLEARTIHGCTPLHEACAAGQVRCVKYLLESARKENLRIRAERQQRLKREEYIASSNLDKSEDALRLHHRSHLRPTWSSDEEDPESVAYMVKDTVRGVVDDVGILEEAPSTTFRSSRMAYPSISPDHHHTPNLYPSSSTTQHGDPGLSLPLPPRPVSIFRVAAEAATVDPDGAGGYTHIVDDSLGQTALQYAVEAGHILCVKALLDPPYKAKVDAADAGGRTALHVACQKADIPIVNLLLERGANANKKDKVGWTAMCHAVVGGHVRLVQLIADKHGGKYLEKDEMGQSLMHLAARYGHPDLIPLLMNRGRVPIDGVTEEGLTPLTLAATLGQAEVAYALVKAGAMADLATARYETA